MNEQMAGRLWNATDASKVAEVVLLVINYRCEDEVLCLVREALAQRLTSGLSIVVVDNSTVPDQHPLWDLARTDPRVCISAPGRNMGYFGAAAWALERRRETMAGMSRQPSSDWIIVSNPHIRFEDQHVLQRLCELHFEHPPSVVAPAIMTSAGRDANPHLAHRPSATRMRLYAWLYNYHWSALVFDTGSRMKQRLADSIGRRRARPERIASGARCGSVREIYAGHGAFLAFHRSFFEAGGSLEYGAFLFGEEIYIAETVRRCGGRILYDPRLRVLHGEHPTTRKSSDELLEYSRSSYRYLLDEYFRRGIGHRRPPS